MSDDHYVSMASRKITGNARDKTMTRGLLMDVKAQLISEILNLAGRRFVLFRFIRLFFLERRLAAVTKALASLGD